MAPARDDDPVEVKTAQGIDHTLHADMAAAHDGGRDRQLHAKQGKDAAADGAAQWTPETGT